MAIRFDPVGRCIYCGATDALTREHIIPFSLNGDLILPDASCRTCAKITGKIEGYVTRTMFGAFRAAYNMQTRNPKQRPKAFPVRPGRGVDRAEPVLIPTGDFPVNMHLPVLPVARYLRGLPDTNTVRNAGFWSWVDVEKGRAVARRLGTRTINSNESHPAIFVQMLAKIGHAYAVSQYGVDGFEPLAVDWALDRKRTINYIVGCDETIPPQPEPDLHRLQLYVHAENRTIACQVRLFAQLGAPLYHVVVGIKNRLK